MSEQLKEFGARAETLVEIPDFAELDQRGRELRVHRRVGVAAAVVAVLAVVGVTVTQIHRNDVDNRPIKPPGAVVPPNYPGGTMKDLEEGTYRFHPSLAQSDLTAELTVPAGWNSWVGPNRFDGHGHGRTNGEALGHLTWYVGALILEVDGVNTHGCSGLVKAVETPEQVVKALGHSFSMPVVQAPEPVTRFGRPATHMRLLVTKEAEACKGGELTVFQSSADGYIQYAGPGTFLDVWVVDVGGTPIYVQRAWTRNAPAKIRSELDDIINSIEFQYPE